MMGTVEESNNEDGNNAEHYHEREQNRAEEGNRNGNHENGHLAPVNNVRPNSYESDCIVVQDDQEDDLEPLSDILQNAARHSSHPRVSSLPIMTRDKADETGADSEAATPISPMPHPANMSIRRGLSREQSSSLDPLSDEGIFSSIEQQLLQDRRSEFLIYKSLQASMKTTNESSEKCLKWLKERQVAYAENLKQVALNASPSHEEEIQPALDGIADKLKKNLKKRKFLEDDKEERATKLGNPGYQEYYKKASL